ncbi:MAG: hypothetical protein QOD07_1005 [Frankiaceae bacterium]|jgi:hypothetical protein|nr:hypothetical protein [Frankiaceae bacterium]
MSGTGEVSVESMSDVDNAPNRLAPVEPTNQDDSRHGYRWLVVVAVVLAVIAGAVSIAFVMRPSPKLNPLTATTRPIADAHAQFPYQTASDVVSYADHVAIVTAVSQREAPRNEQPEAGAPRDSISRLVTFRIDDVLWSRAGARGAPTKFTALWWGWLAKGHQQFVMDGTPWVFVGGHYVVPIAYDGKEFSLIQPYAVFRFDRGAVTLEEQHTALARSLDGASRRAAAKVFQDATPDPLAVRYADLLPRDRLNAVIAARKS